MGKSNKELLAEVIIAFCKHRGDCVDCPARKPCDVFDERGGIDFRVEEIVKKMEG